MSDSGLRVVSVHGADKHIDIAKKLFLPATSGYVEAGIVTKAGYYGVVQGAADTNTPKVYISGRVPEDFVSFTSLKVIWISPAVSGNMVWYLRVAYTAVGANYTYVWDTSSQATATAGADLINATEGGVDLVGLAAGDYFGISFVRDGADGDDTLDDTVDLLGFLFEYIANQ